MNVKTAEEIANKILKMCAEYKDEDGRSVFLGLSMAFAIGVAATELGWDAGTFAAKRVFDLHGVTQ